MRCFAQMLVSVWLIIPFDLSLGLKASQCSIGLKGRSEVIECF